MKIEADIDEVILRAARRLAAAQNKSLGEVLSELARKGLRSIGSRGSHQGFPVFEVSEDVQPITPEMVHAALGDVD